MVLDPSNSSSLQQLVLKGLTLTKTNKLMTAGYCMEQNVGLWTDIILQ